MTIKRHVHPRAQPPVAAPQPTGIDYLTLIRQRREQELARRIDYRNLPGTPADDAGHDDEEQTG